MRPDREADCSVDQPQVNETVLVHLEMPDEQDQEDPSEFRELALAAGADPVAMVTGPALTSECARFL